MTFSNLPAELQGAIVDELLDDKAQLLQCRLISKDFESIVTPAACKTLTLSRERGCSNVFTGLFPENSAILSHVKEIKFRALERFDQVFRGDELDETLEMFTHFVKFPSLHTLRLYFHHDYEEELYQIEYDDMSPVRTLQIEIFDTLAELALNDGFTLHELEIDGLLALPNESFHLDGIRPLLATLTTLQIHLVTDNAEYFDFSDENYCAFWKIDLTNVLAAAKNLQSLTLISDYDTCGFDYEGWKNIRLPKLKYLRFESIVFTNPAYYKEQSPLSSDGGAEGFILRHGNSLEDVDLSLCAVEIAEEDTNPRTWAMIWNNFKVGLPRLRSFTYHPLPGQPGPEDDFCGFLGYVFFLVECRYVNDFDQDPVDAALDRSAYAALQRNIQNRLALEGRRQE